MPKERLHLLLADQSLQELKASLGSSPFSEAQEFAYFLGAISPDALFYDLPLFRLSSLGEAYHRLEGESCLPFLASIYEKLDRDRDPEAAAWILGIANHFLADGIWHPIIRKMSDPDSFFCSEFKFSKRQCHHWLESELEAYWLARLGPADGYLPLLKRFGKSGKTRTSCIEWFRVLLMGLKIGQVPDAKTIGGCLSWQALLLRLFSLAVWARWRKLLLDNRLTRSFGVLIVPVSKPSRLAKPTGDRGGFLADPCDDAFMTRSAASLAEHIRAFLQRLKTKFEMSKPRL